jgi:hypothetical protein
VSLVMPVGVVLFGNCKEIQTEFVIPQSDLTWPEAAPNQHWPQIAFVVIHFVIVDLYFWTQSEPKCAFRSTSEHLSAATPSV